jgi:Uma2 family endonuclease
MLATAEFPKMTAAEYLVWEEQQNFKYEYLDGEIIAMTGGSIPHNDLALNLYRALYPHLKDRGCKANVADVKVRVEANSAYFYPDLVVSCHPQDLGAMKLVEFPTLIIEVLSPSTSKDDSPAETLCDRTKKFAKYRGLNSLQEYLLIESDRVSVDLYRRGAGRMWHYYPYLAGDIIELASIDFSCTIESIYEDVILIEESEEN